MGSAIQGICDEAYFAYVEEAIPRRTQPIGKRGQLEIENLAAADQQHKLELVALFQRPPGILLPRDKALIIDHHLDCHIQFTFFIQHYFARLLTMFVNNMANQIRHCAVGD